MPATLEAAADLMRRLEWDEAARVLADIPDRSLSVQLQHTFARNMAALRKHRPAVHALLASAPVTDDCKISQTKSGSLTLFRKVPDGRFVCLSAGPDPVAAFAQQQAHLDPLFKQLKSVLLSQIGDGLLLQWLAQRHELVSLSPHWHRSVYIVDPDTASVLHTLMIRDFSGENGPIESARFHWFIGPEWVSQIRSAFLDDPYLTLPSIAIRNGLHVDTVAKGMAEVQADVVSQEADLAELNTRYYNSLSRTTLASLFSSTPPRPPRVLLLTSRFTTVLQYSTRDIADAMENLGWETQILIEPTPQHALTALAIRRAVASFKPDVVLTIDHLRDEPGLLFPPSLPFICWIQDDLPNLISPKAAGSIGYRDFILTCAEDHYSFNLGYPRRQCIHLEKLTRLPSLPAAWSNTGNDLVFVSNASSPPQQIIESYADETASSPMLMARIRACGRKMMERYETGGHISTVQQLRPLFAAAETETGGPLLPSLMRDQVVLRLFNGLNNALYRQQALQWVVRAASTRNLSLAIYGQGWDKNPEFASMAKGYIGYGSELEELTRRTRINLQIVPFSCLHQRLLDGWAAGGFFLVRSHDVESLWLEWADIVDNLVPANIRSVADARAALDEKTRPRFDNLTARITEEVGMGNVAEDLVASFRDVRDELGMTAFVRPPRMKDVLFHNADQVAALIDRYIDNEPLRREIVAEQRAFTAERFTYEAGMRRAIHQIGGLIASEDAAWFNNKTAPVEGR